MVTLTIEPATPHELALFKCPADNCGGFLVPYEIWRSEKNTTVFGTCYSCKKRYRFGLEGAKQDNWLLALRNFTWRCPFCGENPLDLKKAVGKKVLRVHVSCTKCGKESTKKIEHRTYDVLVAGLQVKPEVSDPAPGDDDGNRAGDADVQPPVKKVYIICPACDLEIEETFHGYCPACGFVFSADIEEK